MASDGVAGGQPLTGGKWAGWAAWSDPHPDTFLQAIGRGYMRAETATKALVGLETRSSHRNRLDTLHGGFLAAFADHAYFGGLWAMGHKGQINGVTIDLTMQYLGSGNWQMLQYGYQVNTFAAGSVTTQGGVIPRVVASGSTSGTAGGAGSASPSASRTAAASPSNNPSGSAPRRVAAARQPVAQQ